MEETYTSNANGENIQNKILSECIAGALVSLGFINTSSISLLFADEGSSSGGGGGSKCSLNTIQDSQPLAGNIQGLLAPILLGLLILGIWRLRRQAISKDFF